MYDLSLLWFINKLKALYISTGSARTVGLWQLSTVPPEDRDLL